MKRDARLSIPTRIFLGFAVVLIAFGAVATTSLVQHTRTAASLRLLRESYLPLSFTVGRASATQSVFLTFVDGLMEGRDPTASRGWIDAWRRGRPSLLRRALASIEQAEELDAAVEDRATLARVRATLDQLLHLYRSGDSRYHAFFEAIVSGEREQAQKAHRKLGAHERMIEAALHDARRTLRGLVAIVSARAAEKERQAALLLVALTALGLLMGLAVIVWAHRMLAPLPRLQERVAAVARGDLSAKLKPTTDDELGRLAGSFERMVEALAARDARLLEAERLAAIGQMAAHVTHEVRNPLSSIGLNVDLLEEEVGDDRTEARALLHAIHREIDRLTAVTEEYLRLARLPEPRLQPEDLGEVVESVARFVRPEIEDAGLTFVVEVAAGLPAIAMDEPQLRQALLNLLRNARESMEEGTITLIAEQAEEGVAVRVSDEGQGIPEEEQARMFDLFYTTKERGTGLGLPLTHQIVVAHRGTIRCESRPGHGATFVLWFPVDESS